MFVPMLCRDKVVYMVAVRLGLIAVYKLDLAAFLKASRKKK